MEDHSAYSLLVHLECKEQQSLWEQGFHLWWNCSQHFVLPETMDRKCYC